MPDSIGQKLRQAREGRKLSLEQVAQATRIRLNYLQALEQDDLERLPSSVQARGFLRSYARLLNLDLDSIESDLQLEPEKASLAAEQQAPTLEQGPPQEQAREIFTILGARLRRQREILGLSLEDVERHTRVRLRYLTALEAGQMIDLPSPVQARGMLSNYAHFLGMDAEELLLQFADGLQAGLAARQAARALTQPVKKRSAPPRLRSLISLDLLVGGLLVIFIGGFVIWGALRVFSIQSGRSPTVTAPSISDVLSMPTTTVSPTATASPVGTPAAIQPTQELAQGTPEFTEQASTETLALVNEPELPTLTSTQPSFPLSAVQIYIVVRQRAWMKILVDGIEEFSGRVLPGSAYLFSGQDRVEILTGNGAALNVYFNQVDQGVMGIFGEVIYRVYTPDGVLAPTPTITLTQTPTNTEAITATPTITPTETLAP